MGDLLPRTDATAQLVGHYPGADTDAIVHTIKQATDYALIVGAPGAGKTSILLRSIVEEHYHHTPSNILLMAYTNLASVNSFAAGAGAIYDYGRISAKLGYYYRVYGGHGSRITEPFNIYYELSVHLLQQIENWDIDLTLTNNETFELERHYQPSFIAECFHFPTSKLGIAFGIGCKPAGMFNLSADYYQSFIKTGICFRW